MGDEEIRNYLNSQASAPRNPAGLRVVRRRAPAPAPAPEEKAGYEDFNATHLFCPTCRQAMPVRERLMLFLPDGDLFDYLCTSCGTSLGTRKAGR